MVNEKTSEDASWLRKTLDEKEKGRINTKSGKRTEEWAAVLPSSGLRCHRWECGELSSALQILLTTRKACQTELWLRKRRATPAARCCPWS